MPTQASDRRARATLTISAMLGAINISRAVSDPNLSREILQQTRDQLISLNKPAKAHQTADASRIREIADSIAKLDVWIGMPHGFVTNVVGFNAATQALKATGAFLTERQWRTARWLKGLSACISTNTKEA